MPIFYFTLPPMNTNALQVLHVLHKIQVTTGRRVIAITPWPFWPADTAKEKFFNSFVRGLTPGIRYVWIPKRVQRFLQWTVETAARLLQTYGTIYMPVGVNSTIRYLSPSTLDHTDILNDGARVSFRTPSYHEDDMDSRLRDLGIPHDAWFVCAHAREHGWLTQINAYDLKIPANYQHEQEDHRNVDIEDYLPAIDYITGMGGLVVRMGDPSMKPMNGVPGVIDYPFTEHKSMPMDLHLVSRCRFVLGCNSGFSGSFPHPFDTPLLITNAAPIVNSARFPYSNTLFLFNDILKKDSGRRLGLPEMFTPEILTANQIIQFDSLGYKWGSNTPEEILEATKEMLQLVEANGFNSPRTPEQDLFHSYRLEAIDSLWSRSDQKGDSRYAKLRTSESRISATFASRHFAGDKPEPMDAGVPTSQRA